MHTPYSSCINLLLPASSWPRRLLRVSVSFWVLALDHDLRVATDMIGSVFVRNPAGTKVALWEEVALDEGKKW